MTATAIEQVATSRRIAPREAAQGGDQLLLTAVGLLLFFGILAIVTSSTGSVLQLELGSSYFLYRHLAWLAIGACAFSVMAAVDYRLWQRFSVLLFFGTVVLLVLLEEV